MTQPSTAADSGGPEAAGRTVPTDPAWRASRREPRRAVSTHLRSAGMRYFIALALVAALLAFEWLTQSYLDQRLAPAFLILLTLAAAWLGGFGPAVFVSVVGLFAVTVAFPKPEEERDGSLAGLVTYFLITLGVAMLGAAMARARRTAEIAAERFKTTLSSIGDAVLVTDRQGRIVSLNPIAEALTGWTYEEAIGQPLEKVFVIVDEGTRTPTANPAARAMQEGIIVGLSNHTLLVTKQGLERPIDDSAAPIRAADGSLVGCVLVFRDVTERRAAERELRKLADKLGDTDRRKNTFLATLAHELRNPLAPISAGLQVLKATQDDPSRAEEVRSTMERQTRLLTALVDDLLDISRITSGKLILRKCVVDLQDVLRTAVDAAQPMIDDAGHALTIDLPQQPICLDADPQRLAQVFANLLNNAAKYTPQGGSISLAVSSSDGHAIVSVRDTGIGIPRDRWESIFEMFSQIEHPLQRDSGGLGIGLTLVRSLVEMHGGSIEVHSEGPGQGSEFTVRLPALTGVAAAEAAAIESPNAVAATPRRVLVADDNRAAADMLAMVVRLLGHEVRTANDGLEAVGVGAEFHPDIVLMDIGMPKLNGHEAARLMRREPWGQNITLVAVTGWGQDEDRLSSKEAGFDHHLVKPVEPSELKRLLSSPAREPLSPPHDDR